MEPHQCEAAACSAAEVQWVEHQQEDASHEIRVAQGSRQALQVWGSTVLPLPADQCFDLITHPNNEQIFRHLDRCTGRRVLAEEPGGKRRVVESEHVASWRIWWLRGSLSTRLRVEQDFGRLTADFSLLPAGRLNPLRHFDGRWRVEPLPPERCAHLQDSSSAGPSSSSSDPGGSGASGAPGNGGSGGGCCCQLTLEQALQPAVPLPPPLGGLLRHLACGQLKGIFEDLQKEARRINSGRPTLW